MNCIELMKNIRTSDEPAAVIVMTAFADVATAVGAKHAGAADYLTKALNFDELLVVAKRVTVMQELVRRRSFA